MLRSVTPSRRWLPELDNPLIVLALVALGGAGALAEVLATPYAPRLVLFLVAFALGALGAFRLSRKGV